MQATVIKDHLTIFFSGFMTALMLLTLLGSLAWNGFLEDYIPEFKEIQYVDIGEDVPQIKLYLKQRMGLPGFSQLSGSGCLRQLLDQLQQVDAEWESPYCYASYSHLTYKFSDGYNKITVLKQFYWEL